MEDGPRRDRAEPVALLEKAPDADQLHLGLLQEARGQLPVHHPRGPVLRRLPRRAHPALGIGHAQRLLSLCHLWHSWMLLALHAGIPVLLLLLDLPLELIEPRALPTLRWLVRPSRQRQRSLLGAGAFASSLGGRAEVFLVEPGVIPDILAGDLFLVPVLVHPQHVEDSVGQRSVADFVGVPSLEQPPHDCLVVVLRHVGHLT
mmetsp:Transcript_33786/g.95815  ORF Transcript_33786/g.95815 Transcript_33786/m.95815 type:complete len:203 (-) Transcript_33786:437-1045(-)